MRKSAIGASSSVGMRRLPVDFDMLLVTIFRASFQPTLPFETHALDVVEGWGAMRLGVGSQDLLEG